MKTYHSGQNPEDVFSKNEDVANFMTEHLTARWESKSITELVQMKDNLMTKIDSLSPNSVTVIDNMKTTLKILTRYIEKRRAKEGTKSDDIL